MGDNLNIPEIPDYMMHGCKITNPDLMGVEVMFGAAKKKSTKKKTTSKKKTTTKKKKPLPKKWSIKDKFPEVYTQNCGCCTTCASLGCDDYYNHGPGKPWKPSYKFTYWLQRRMQGETDMSSDEGSIIEYGLKCIKKYGACSAKVWSNEEPVSKKPSKAAFENGLKGKEVTKFYRILNFKQLKEAISLNRPVAMSMGWLKQTYNEEFILDSWTQEEYWKNPGGHATIVVGYDDEKELLEIRNSWGPNWGNNGYIYIPYKLFKENVSYGDTWAVIK